MIPTLVSVIIPAYNCEAYIGATLSSLLAQTMGDFEVLLVNDGSTDHTLDVINDFVRKDERIRVITVDNAGPANARNLAIREAKGSYLYFMDSDDLIAPDMLAEMTALATKHDLDCVACGYTMENLSTKKPHVKQFRVDSFVALQQAEYRTQLMPMIKAHLMYVVWNKLFRTAMIKENGVVFGDYLSGEDRLFNTQTYPLIQRFGFIDKPFYRYFLRGQQTLANRFVENRFEASLACHEALIKAYQMMGLYDTDNRRYIDFVFVKGVVSCFTQLSAKGCGLRWKQKKELIHSILENSYVRDAIRSEDEEFGYSELVNRVLRTGNPTLIYWMSKMIFLLQFKLNTLYLNLKHGKA